MADRGGTGPWRGPNPPPVIDFETRDRIYGGKSWTLEEKMLAIQAIANHPLADFFDGAQVDMIRYEYGGDRVAGGTGPQDMFDPAVQKYQVYVFDFAWEAAPQGSVAPYDPSNFEQTVVHESTHVAQGQNPELLRDYGAWIEGYPFPVGTDYSAAEWSISEDMALTVSTIVYGDPDTRQHFVGGVTEHSFWFVHWSTTRSRDPRADWFEETTGQSVPYNSR
jgi:hypothetical protein